MQNKLPSLQWDMNSYKKFPFYSNYPFPNDHTLREQKAFELVLWLRSIPILAIWMHSIHRTLHAPSLSIIAVCCPAEMAFSAMPTGSNTSSTHVCSVR